jgi:glycosyltransferase involved in cell wall biosynthesis
MNIRPRLLFLITEDWYFWSHRLDVARAARDAGFDVMIATRVTEHGERIQREGFRLFPISLVRQSRNPFMELAAVLELVWLYRRERPAIVHHVALKPILYGSLAAWISGVPIVVNAFAGLGYAFTDATRRKSLAHTFLCRALTTLLRLSQSVIIFQNKDDRELLLEEGVVGIQQTRIIPGSGVDTKRFDVSPSAEARPIVMLASRMLWDKGVGEFVEASRRLKQNGLAARYVLVGRCDEHNPAAIEPTQLRQWVEEGVVEWWEHRDEMSQTLASATIVVLPSYREGLPKVLLEAAACGKPLIATDVPGCHDIVTHGVNGLLVPARDSSALAVAIDSLLRDSSLRAAMGMAGRAGVVRAFSVEKVAGQVVDLYRELLARPKHGQQPTGSV